MENCKICNKEYKNLKALSSHIILTHKITTKEYYDTFLLKKDEGDCVVCNNQTTYRNMGTGYLDTCSIECRNLNKNIKRDYWKGKKQSKEMIDKRIKNTNQEIKELSRKNTMLTKYGVNNPMNINEIKNKVSDKLKGRNQDRTNIWQQNIVTSKQKNGTLKHSSETKKKISNSLNKHYKENLDREKYISKSNNLKHLCGWYNGMYFRSSLELSFLVNNSNIKFTSCEVKKYSVEYSINGKNKTYYPDYTDGEFIYEVKPISLLNFGVNPFKILAAKEKFGENYRVITEEECNYIQKDTIKKLIDCGNIVLVKNSEKIFEKYKY